MHARWKWLPRERGTPTMTPMPSVFEADQSMEMDIGCCREDLSWSSDKQSCTWNKQSCTPTNNLLRTQTTSSIDKHWRPDSRGKLLRRPTTSRCWLLNGPCRGLDSRTA